MPASPNIESGQNFTYRFSVPHSGTYWAHPHVGLDTDYGLYLPSSSTTPASPSTTTPNGSWFSTTGRMESARVRNRSSPTFSPETAWVRWAIRDGQHAWHGWNEPRVGRNHAARHLGGPNSVESSALLGGDAGDVSYPYYLINGRIASAPTTFSAASRSACAYSHHQRGCGYRFSSRPCRSRDVRDPYGRFSGRTDRSRCASPRHG